jgi:hypothetical protein
MQVYSFVWFLQNIGAQKMKKFYKTKMLFNKGKVLTLSGIGKPLASGGSLFLILIFFPVSTLVIYTSPPTPPLHVWRWGSNCISII